MMANTLVLFDIDGTLLKVGSINRQSLIDALQKVYGTEGSAGSHDFSGQMDSVIIHEVLRYTGLDEQEIQDRFHTVKETYIDIFRKQATEKDVTLMPGVIELLEALSGNEHVTLGLLTGNFEKSGRHKLILPAINHYFPFGAFADDAWHRNDLPSIAIQRAEALLNHRFPPDKVVIIGDTEHDIACAKASGSRSLAVATGNYSYDRLERKLPDAIFPDLGDTSAVLERILTF
ncbi:phosphoglycolate phosphatase [Prosthecochloris sp. CIB 2401]|nr:phosphoglycolate phosphatase [Prosthecochloris sp. CIB 2401]